MEINGRYRGNVIEWMLFRTRSVNSQRRWDAVKDRGSKLWLGEKLDDAKDMIERETGLRPTTHKIINGIWQLKAPNRLKDHLWNLILGRLKTGKYWSHIPDHEDGALHRRRRQGSRRIRTTHLA